MFYRGRVLLFPVFALLLTCIDIRTTSVPRNAFITSNEEEAPYTPPWLDPSRTYFSHYISPVAKRPNGTCWRAPVNAPKIAIVAMFKNEEQGMREWLDHYMWQGIDAILLLDNGSTDNWKPIILEYNRVTVHDAPLRHRQIKYYEESLSWLHDERIDIAIFADLDEYLFSLDQRSLQEVLIEFFFDPAMADVSELFIPWSMFGSSGLVQQPESVRESFTWRRREEPGIQYANGKTFFKVRDVLRAEIHVPQLGLGTLVYAGDRFEGEVFADMFDVSRVSFNSSGPPLRLNHFVVQSKEFYKNVKMTRGAADIPEFENIRSWTYFERSDFHDVQDTALKTYVLEARQHGTLHGFHCGKS